MYSWINIISNIRPAIAGLVSCVLLFSLVSHVYADANKDRDKRLAEKFAPILILTENPTPVGRDYAVINPEPVEIVGADSVSNVQAYAVTLGNSPYYSGPITSSPPLIQDFIRHYLDGKVDFSSNKFAFLTGHEPIHFGPILSDGTFFPTHILRTYFDYPGGDRESWEAAYFPEEDDDDSHAGWRFPNTAYFRVFERDSSDNYGSVVIKYYFFYPFNDWANNHEGDWPRVNVMVTSRDATKAEIHGVDYTFHGKGITYYNITDNPSTTNNIRESIAPVGGRHPVVYVSAGGHGHFPTPGHYEDGGRALVDEDLTPYGLVLHPEIVDSDKNQDIAQSYDLVWLPKPVKTLDNNMGLDPEMSWLGSYVSWGTPKVASLPLTDNDGPEGPFYSGWGKIRYDSNSDDRKDYSKSKIPYTSFHNFPIVGEVDWSGTVSLRGDVVVFPGATLTIESGTVIEFEPRTDIHKFPAQGHGVDNRAEIFVYGILNAEGTSTSSIRFRRKSGTPAQAGYAWGGIRIMEGGSVDLDHTTIRNTPPPPPPTGLTAQAGTGQATLRWDIKYPIDAGITEWQYRLKPEGVGWRDWQTIPNSGPLTAEHTVTGLINGETSTFLVRAVNSTGAGSASAAVSVDLRPLSELVKPTHTPTLTARAGDGEVTLSWDEPNAIQCTWQYQQTRTLGVVAEWENIPDSKTFTTEYTVTGLTNGLTYFFKVRAVNSGGQGPASAAVSVTPTVGGHRVPPQPTGLSVEGPITRPSTLPGQLYVSWDAVSATPAVKGYTLRYQSKPARSVEKVPWSDWSILPDVIAAGTTSYTHTGLSGNTLYRYQVRATNAQGHGAWSAAFPEGGLEPDSPTEPPARRPEPPQNLKPTATNESVELTWQAPANNGGATITDYRYRYRATESTRWSPSAEGVPLGPTTHRTVVKNLINGTPYIFEVWAVNRAGNGASASVTATPVGKPDAPVVSAHRRDGAIDLHIVLGADNGSPIKQVERRISHIDGEEMVSAWWQRDPIDPNNKYRPYPSLFTLGFISPWSKLTNGKAYTFAVRTVNKKGASAVTSVTATPAGRPGAPPHVMPSPGDGQVVLRWDAADANGAAIERYEVQWRTAKSKRGGSNWASVPGGHAARDSTITGLANGVLYEFSVRAVNEMGAGASASQSARPQAGLVRLPLTASRGDRQVALSWTAPSKRVSVHKYQVRHRISDSGQDWSRWSPVSGGSTVRDSTITGLTNGVTYQFAVQAIDSKGSSVAVSDVVSATPAARPGTPTLTAVGGDGQVRLGWTAADANGSLIKRYEMQWRVANSGHGWPDWADVPGGRTARDSTVAGLLNGTEYEFAVRAVNGVGAGGSASQSATPQGSSRQVSFGSVSYQAPEGGAAVSVSVELSPQASQTVSIPVVVSADEGTEPGDYTVAGLTNGTVRLTFDSGESSQAFTITANDDDDIDDETVSLSFGKLPAGVVAKGTTRQATVQLLDDDDDLKPVFVPSSGTEDALVGSYFSFTRPSASGGNGSLSYSVSGTCPGLSVTTSSVSGSPSSSGQYGITWTVTDADGDTDTYSLQISVAADTSPSFASSGTSRSAIVGQYFSFTRPSASGGNGPLSYSVSGTCPGLSVTTSSVSGSPSSSGQYGITWTVTDADGDTDTYSLQISVAADTSPSFASSGTSRSAIVGQYFSFTRPSASGGNGPLSYSVSGTCPGLSVTTSSVSGQPSSSGQCGITWTVTDADGDTDTYSLQISVAADTSPSFASSGTSRSAIVGSYFSFTRPSASGGNGSLSYSVSGTCPGLTVTSSSVSGQPSTAGQCGITWTVRDSDGDTDTYSLQISVAADTSPSFASSGTSRSAVVGSYFSFTRPSASGGNGPLSYSVSGTCPGLSVTTSSVSGSPSSSGQCGITWTVRDSDGDTDTYSLQISVAADTSPSFASSGTSRSAIVGQYFSFTRPSASGGNGSLSYSVSGTCPGLTVTSSSVSGSPSSSGQYGITWTVTDADGDTDTYSLQISVASRGV